MLSQAPEVLYESMEKTPFTWVDTEEQLESLASLLDSCREIAIDTEHHDLRSFQGFTCLIQISTRTQDFIIDALELRHHLHILNSSLTNPEIVKVFHGADSDIQWLQRDFGIYIVNLFDTYHASHALGLQGHGLAFLLKFYCNVVTDKRFQRADWRLRPVPADMLYYARSDTHYLLYIYDRMRNDLIGNSDSENVDLLKVVLSRSATTSAKVYKKDIYDAENGYGPNGWKNMLRKYPRSMTAEQLAIFRALHSWRDQTAREADESVHYILPNHMLFNLVDIIPNNAQQILACCSPIPTYVRMYASEIASLIENSRLETSRNIKAREEELLKLKADLEAKDKEFAKRKLEGPIHVRFNDKDESDLNLKTQSSTKESYSHIPKKLKSSIKINYVSTSNLLGDCLKAAKPPSLSLKAAELKESLKLEASKMKIQQTSITPEMIKPSIVHKEDSQKQETEDISNVMNPVLNDVKSEFIILNDEQIDVVANIGKSSKDKKKKKKSKSKKIKQLTNNGIDVMQISEKSSIAMELDKLSQRD